VKGLRCFATVLVAGLPASGSGALRARVGPIERPTRCVDLQVCPFSADAAGLSAARAPLAAAERGVRARPLTDEPYTAGDDPVRPGWATQPNAALRSFNAFRAGRDGQVGRLVDATFGKARPHRRTHDELLDRTTLAEQAGALVDGAVQRAAWRTRPADDGQPPRWTAADGDGVGHDAEPDTDLGSRRLLDLPAPFVGGEVLWRRGAGGFARMLSSGPRRNDK
jgi:hypothetical protein